GKKLRLEPGLVEPGGANLARLVGDPRGENVQAPSAATRPLADDAVQDGFVVAEQLGDSAFGNGMLVTTWPMGKEVTHGEQAQSGESPLGGRPDTWEHLDRLLEQPVP